MSTFFCLEGVTKKEPSFGSGGKHIFELKANSASKYEQCKDLWQIQINKWNSLATTATTVKWVEVPITQGGVMPAYEEQRT